MACRLYVLTVLLETIVDITIEADLLLRVKTVSKEHQSSSDTTKDPEDINVRLPVYLAIFCFAQ